MKTGRIYAFSVFHLQMNSRSKGSVHSRSIRKIANNIKSQECEVLGFEVVASSLGFMDALIDEEARLVIHEYGTERVWGE